MDTDVTIVGMGPTGALLGILLAQHDIKTAIVERDATAYSRPRAVQLDHEVLRLLNLAGVANEVQAASQPVKGYEFVSAEGELLMGFYPESELAPTGYAWNNLFHQPSLEAALRLRLDNCATVTKLEGAQLQQLKQNANGVVAHIQCADKQKAIHSRYLVGCDGGRSTVRQLLGIPVDDLGFDEPWLVVDALLPEGTKNLADKGLQLCDPARPTTSMPAGPGRHRWEFMLLPGENETQISSKTSVRELLSAWIDPEMIVIERIAVYHFHATFAERWAHGGVFLAGDAAHQMPPFMGQGLCSGARDAANIAWKLAAVLHAQANPNILGTLQQEREPQIRQITAMAMDLGKLVCTIDPQQALQRDKEILAQPIEARTALVNGVVNVGAGVLKSHGGGAILPESYVDTEGGAARLDMLAGYNAIVVIASAGQLDDGARADLAALLQALPGTRLCTLAQDEWIDDTAEWEPRLQLNDEQGYMKLLLGDASCILARPDRVVFACGDIAFINEQWRRYLADDIAT